MTIDRITVGQVEVLSVPDCQMPVDACDFFLQKTVESFAPFAEFVDEDCAVRGGINVASFLLMSQGRRILVDAGLGPGPVQEAGGASGDLTGEMHRRGIDPNSIDTVVITHLHFDHIGWLATDSGGEVQPTFANAKYVIPETDWNLLLHPDKVHRAGGQFSQRALEIFNQSRNIGMTLEAAAQRRVGRRRSPTHRRGDHRANARSHPRASELGHRIQRSPRLRNGRRGTPALAGSSPPVDGQCRRGPGAGQENSYSDLKAAPRGRHRCSIGALSRPGVWTDSLWKGKEVLAALDLLGQRSDEPGQALQVRNFQVGLAGHVWS